MIRWIASLTFLAGAVSAGGNRLTSTRVIEAPRADVWKAFTTQDGAQAWMVAHAEIDLKVGGLMRTHYDPKGNLGDDNSIENTILLQH